MHTALALIAVASALVAAGAWVMPAEGESSAGQRLLAASALAWGVVAVAETSLHLIGSAAALAVAMVALVLGREAPDTLAGRASTLADGLIVAGSLGFMAYVAGLDSLADEWLLSTQPAWLVVAPALMGAAAAGTALSLCSRATGAPRVRLALLSAGFLILAAAQAAEAVSGNAEPAAAGAAGWLLVALAAQLGAAADPALTVEPRLPARASALVPALPFAGALAAGAVELARPGPVPDTLVWLGLAVLLLGLARQVFARVETISVWHSLAAGSPRVGAAPRSEERPSHAYDDPLTGLANRDLLLRRCGLALEGSAILCIDLSAFGEVNESLGEAAGDELLVAVGRRLANAMRGGDTVARLGSDEFAVLAPGIDGEERALALAHRAELALRDPFVTESGEARLSASIGVALGAAGAQGGELLGRARAALEASRSSGRGIELHTEGMEEAASERLGLEADLRLALGTGELTLAYQPVFDLARGGIRSVEALVRWRHPVRGDVPPADFIPVAEASGLILELGAWVLEAGCAQWRTWLDAGAGWARLGLGVNLSARQLHDPRLVGNLRGALLASGMVPAALTLELPESALVADPAGARSRLEALRAVGVRIAIDDFGSGPSALGSLRDFPVDALKLDRAFLHGLRVGTPEATLAAALLAMGKALGVETAAAGVERAEQLAELRQIGCDLGQGHLLGGPLGPEGLAILLANSRQVAA